MNHVDEMYKAYSKVQRKSELLNEGAIADKMRANLKKKKAEWDSKGEKAKDAGYKALAHAKKTQADLEKSDFIQNVGESREKSSKGTCALTNTLRMVSGLKPISGKKGEQELGDEKSIKTRERKGKMINAIKSLNEPKQTGRYLTKEEFLYTTAFLLGENICRTSDEALIMIGRFEDISEEIIDSLFE